MLLGIRDCGLLAVPMANYGPIADSECLSHTEAIPLSQPAEHDTYFELPGSPGQIGRSSGIRDDTYQMASTSVRHPTK